MTRTLIVSLLVALLAGAAADDPDVRLSEIPSPRPTGWSVDLTGRIPPETLAQINRIGDDVKAKTGSEMAVVVVGSAGHVNTRGFATRLANRWGIGRKDVNDGLLIFVALDDHQAEIVLGSGIDDPARRGISEEIMQGEMVPRFKAGDPAGAVLAGTQACAERILGLSPEPVAVAPDHPAPVQEAPLPLAQAQPQATPEPYGTGPTWAALAGAAPEASALQVSDVPSPRPVGWSVDLTGQIPPETLAQINRIGDAVKAETGSEIAVVVVGSVGDEDSRSFATQLFNHWGIGRKDVNDGILIFAALDDHKAEIILGSGIDDPLRHQMSEETMQDEMVPRFKAGDPGGAVLAGTQACAERILGASPNSAPVAQQPLAQPLSQEQEPFSVPSIWAALAGLVGLGAGGYSFVRFRPRRCPSCQIKMVRLEEAKDDDYLDAAERTEEAVGSVDYDIWQCPSCGAIAKSRFGSLFSGYSTCSACRAKTARSDRETLRSATYDHGGLVRVTKVCAHCSHREVSTYSTPRLERPRPQSTSGFSSSSGSGSSRSSGGSGFGGGRSSGGGASGRW